MREWLPFFWYGICFYPVISSVDEALYAEKIGFDIVGTTLVDYTDYTKNYKALEELEKVVKVVKIPVIAEGNIDTPLKAKKALESREIGRASCRERV